MLEALNTFKKLPARYWLFVIVLISAGLILVNLDRADIMHDDALYSVRALGYLDITDSNLQTTPLNWFETLPWWSRLSFHDAPPVVFIIQFLFFKIFGTSTLIAKLPFALAGIGSIILTYLIGRQWWGARSGLISAASLGAMTYHSWASRVGYLEPIAMVFLLATIYCFILAQRNPKYYGLVALFAALAIQSKYTVLFIFPALLAYLLIRKKFKVFKVFKDKWFLGSILLLLILLTPIIVYNTQLYMAQGHFDLQLSAIVGQDTSEVWPQINRHKGFTFTRISQVFIEPLQYFSLPAYLLIIFSLLFALFRYIQTRAGQRFELYIFLTLMMVIQFGFIGPSTRFLSLANPFFALAVGLFIGDLLAWSEQKNPRLKLGLGVLVGLIAVIEILFNFNTNIAKTDFDFRSDVLRQPAAAFQQLDKSIREISSVDNRPSKSISGIADVRVNILSDANGNDIIMYDRNLNWFSTLWYLRRWAIYKGQVIVSDSDLAAILPGENIPEFFYNAGATNLFYIAGNNQRLYDSAFAVQENLDFSANVARLFASNQAEETTVFDSKGEQAFTIYRIRLNN